MARGGYYKLDGRKAVPCSLEEGVAEMEASNRRIAESYVGEVWISTVFLVLDHAWHDDKPLVFETMIFGGLHDGDCWRSSTWDEAEEIHARVVAQIEAGARVIYL